jgi:hypothetical protein
MMNDPVPHKEKSRFKRWVGRQLYRIPFLQEIAEPVLASAKRHPRLMKWLSSSVKGYVIFTTAMTVCSAGLYFGARHRRHGPLKPDYVLRDECVKTLKAGGSCDREHQIAAIRATANQGMECGGSMQPCTVDGQLLRLIELSRLSMRPPPPAPLPDSLSSSTPPPRMEFARTPSAP